MKDVLNRRMKQTGRNPPAIERRAAEKGARVTESAIKQVLTGNTVAPSVFTCEAMALGMDIPPLEFIAEILGIRSDDSTLAASKFANPVEIYKELTPSQKQKADVFIDGLVLQLQHIKNQPK
ncbi:MAG: hypothetical protein AABN95_07960 [Acidobacteriota bacterium]